MTVLPKDPAQWFAVDVETLESSAARLPSTSLRTFLTVAIRSLSGARSAINKTKLLSVAQTILTSPLPILSPSEAFELLDILGKVLRTSKDEAVKARLQTVAALVANRIPPRHLTASHSAKEIFEGASETSPALVNNYKNRVSSPTIGRGYLDQLNVSNAIAHVRGDIAKDWYHDPWQWPELEWLEKDGQTAVRDRIRSSDSGEVVKLDVLKQSGGVRPASILSILDRVAYQAIVDRLAPGLLRHLPEWVFGWRLSRNITDDAVTYANNGSEWRLFRAQLDQYSNEFSFTARFDIREFFASIDVDVLHSQLARTCRDSRSLHRIRTFFDGWRLRSGRTGLPQRCLASSLLAQSFLFPVDQLLARISKSGQTKVLRWMDDIWLFSDNSHAISTTVYDIEDSLLQLGLSLNSTKTQVIEGVPKETIDISGIEDELDASTEPGAKLTGIIEGILASAEEVSRADIGFLLAKGRLYQSESVMRLLLPQLERYSYAADFCARTLREQELWRGQEGWYVNYAERHFGSTDWSVPAWGEMFPESTESVEVEGCFVRKVEAGRQTILIPLAADRLSHWMGERSHDLLSHVADTAENAFVKRAVAFAAASTGNKAIREKVESLVTDDHVLTETLRHRKSRKMTERNMRGK